MRVFPRFALVVLALFAAATLQAQPFQADCPLSLVATNPPASDFSLSPHGVFQYNGQVFELRGQTLTTYTVSQTGDMQIAREDFITNLASHDSSGGTAFNNGYLYVSSEAGLEVYDLRGVRAGGVAPSFLSRTAFLHYRRMAASGNQLVGLYPATDMPCAPDGISCYNSIDVFDISTPGNPTRVAQISSAGTGGGFNDVAFNYGYLVTTGSFGTQTYSLADQFNPALVATSALPGTFLVSNGANLLGVGNDSSVLIYDFGTDGSLTPSFLETISPVLAIGRSNPIVFHPQATFDAAGGRLITMVDERDPLTLQPVRTIAFDVFDFGVPQYQGSAPRVYENISATDTDEVKWNPASVGAYVYAEGELTGLETWGACGLMAGHIQVDSVSQLTCGGAEIHGWVSGTNRVNNVEILLDNTSQGSVTVAGFPRTDTAGNPMYTWRATVDLDQTTRGLHVLRLIATDALGNRQQVASQRIYFPGAPGNCTVRRHQLGTHF